MFSNVLDSRAVGFGDTFGQRFMRPGTYRYHVLPAGTGAMVEDRPYTITVEAAADESAMEQYTVTLRAEGDRFVPDDERVTIREGDLIVWSCPDPTAVRFEVQGDKEFFGSARLTNECGYSHAFGLPGEYHWVDAYGNEIRGVVRVKDVRCQSAAEIGRWRKQLARGTLVLIADGKAEPAEVDIVTGQTVFFAVVTGTGISITDRTLLGGSCDDKPEPPKEPVAPAKRPAPPRRRPRASKPG
jgi:plastocyanin